MRKGFHTGQNIPAGGASEEEAKPDDETKDLRRKARYSVSARQPMSDRQKPSGQRIWSIIA